MSSTAKTCLIGAPRTHFLHYYASEDDQESIALLMGITITDPLTGVVPTKFASALVETPEMEEMHKSRTWLGRLGTAGDMAAAVAFLASEDSSYITGECLAVSGGSYSRL